MFDFGISRADFRDIVFESKPWLARQCFDCSTFGWSTLDSALDVQDPTWELMKVLHKGRVDPSKYVEEYVDIGLRRRRILKDKLYAMLIEGATVVLNRIELISIPVRNICSEIGRFVGTQTTSNIYACLGGPQATEVHWDTHDVFVVQISGAKRWEVYAPTHPLPISSQASKTHKSDIQGPPVYDVILEAGDVLYVPRGWWHRVTPVPGKDTVHLTVPVHSPLILDYFIWACASVLPDLLETRHAALGGDKDVARIDEALAAVSKVLSNPEVRASFYERCRQKDRVNTPFTVETLLRNPTAMVRAANRVTLNSRQFTDAVDTLFINGQQGDFDPIQRQVISTLSSHVELTVQQLRDELAAADNNAVDAAIITLACADFIQLTAAPEHGDRALLSC